jgi:tRNA(Ile)-lysidine synthase
VTVHPLLNQVESDIRRYRLFAQGQSILLAVSGGVDSMVLVDLLSRLASAHKWRLVLAHYNHQLRGKAGKKDEALVRETGQRMNLEVVAGKGNTQRFSRQKHISVEMAARQLRHRFLVQAARDRGIQTVATAHHADDQVELFFLRLLRGAGGAGLSGMNRRDPSPEDPAIQLVRPLLDQPKECILDYAQSAGLAFHDDATNRQSDFMRNRIRNDLLPLLENKYQPALRNVVLRSMEIIREENHWVEQSARSWLTRKRRSAFHRLAVALQRQCLQLQLRDWGVGPEFDLIEQLRLNPDVAVEFQGGKRFRRSQDGTVHYLTLGTAPFADPTKITLDPSKTSKGKVEFQETDIGWEILPANLSVPPQKPAGSGSGSGSGCDYFDADKLAFPITLRHWQPGDRFQPIGMGHAAKLQDLFVNLKVPRAERHKRIVALTAAQDIFWVEGLRIGEKFKLDNRTVRCLKWVWSKA